MPNTPENDAPYVIGAIEDAGTAEYPGLNAAHIGGFDGDTINPVVVNADGSFVAAFNVTAPSYFYNINATAFGGSTTFNIGGGAASEFLFASVVAATPGSIVYTLRGRDSGGAPVSILLTPTNGRIVVSEAILANFAPGSSPSLSITGLAANSTVTGYAAVDVTNFFDAAAPTSTVQASPLTPVVPGNGVATLLPGVGLAESFVLQDTASWTTGSTTFGLAIFTTEPLDLTGVPGQVVQPNFPTGTGFRTILTIVPVDGVVSVPQTILQQLESHPGAVVLQAFGAVVGAAPQAQAILQLPVTTITEGLYVQHFGADGNPLAEAVRVDEAANALLGTEDDDGGRYTLSKSPDGGLVISWLGNADTDDQPDALYVRKLDASGNPNGDTVALTGLDPATIHTVLDEDGNAVLTGLADGGFAIAYAETADENYYFFTGNAFPTGLNISGITGQLDRVELVQFTAAGALNGQLRGDTSAGTLLSISVPIVDGVFQVTDAQRAQFAPDAHLTLFVGGLTANSAYAANVFTRDIFDFDETSTLDTLSRTVNAGNNPQTLPDAFFSTNLGQTQSFQVNSFTPAVGATPAFVLSVFTNVPLDLTGLTQYTGLLIPGLVTATANTFANGSFVNTILVTPNGGLVEIPASILAQVDGDQIGSILGISGLAAGTSASVDINVLRASSIIQPGIYAQIFDSDGVAEGPAIRIDDADASLAVAATPDEGEPAVAIVANDDGSFRVTWIANSNDGSGIDRIVSKVIGSDGSPVGNAIDISSGDIPALVAAENTGTEGSVPDEMQLVELGNGGFAALVQLDAEQTFTTFVNAVATPGPLFVFAPQGRMDFLYVAQAIETPAGAHYFVQGFDAGGAYISVEVFANDGFVAVPETVAAQFAPNTSLAIRVEGLQPGSTFVGNVQSSDVWNFGPDSPTVVREFSSVVTPAIPGIAYAANGVATAFDITSFTPAPGQAASFLLYVQSTYPLGLGGETFDGIWKTFIPVSPDGSGHINVPPAVLAVTDQAGAAITLLGLGLAQGSTFTANVTARLPATIAPEGLFVQLFDSEGVATGELIRVDGPASSVVPNDGDYSQSSIQSDGSGGFIVVWESDVDGDGGTDALNSRHFDQFGMALGDATTLDSIPDRIYDEGAEITLYTSGIFADPDPGDTLTFSASGLPAGLDIDPDTGVISGAASASGLFAVTVTATDSGGLSATSSFEVFIIDNGGGGGGEGDNTPPTAVSFANVVASTPENGGSVKVADIIVSDDGNGTNTLALSGADAALFSIIGQALFFNGGDYEAQTGYDVTVSASDTVLLAPPVSASLHLDLTDVAEAQTFSGTNGDDTLLVNPLSLDSWTADGGKGNDSIFTGAGIDHILGGSGDDILSGGDGGDFLFGGSNADLIYGGEGDDTIAGDGDADELHGGDGADSIDGGTGDDTIRGDAGADNILGGSGADDIDGGEGDDTIDGGNGDDSILGSAGLDNIQGGAGDDTISGGADADTLNGGTGADTIDGDEGDDTINGDAGDDLLRGGLGADTINGGTGNDEIYGGDGNDEIFGGAGTDTIYGGADNDNIAGEGSDDFLYGGSGSDTIAGDAGNDIIEGNDGADQLDGGNGDDDIDGGEGDDTILGGTGDDSLRGGLGGDQIDGGKGDDDISGDDGNDTLRGDVGADSIDGGDGDDIIIGGAGSDLLTGGAGSDRFVFELKTDSKVGVRADHITDFDVVSDLIDLSALDANTRLGGDQAFTWIGSASFSKVSGQLRYEVFSGSAHITGDINGDGKADFEIVLDNVTSLPVTDEIFVL